MSDQDELRDRIAYILESHTHLAMDQQACAIIDEFGLTVQEPVEGYPNLLRLVVGRWN